ncbi:MAG: hypothetical protein HY299_12455 [Verrucomicrobia bacterium]|nr:hypothetical protein [Verrucomicrobiota bacterium]
MKTKLSVVRIQRDKSYRRANALMPLTCALLLMLFATPASTTAQSFATYPAGDDLTPSMGQFQIVLDPKWVKIFDAIMPNTPFGSSTVTRRKGMRLYKKGGTLTSPTLYDPQTRIGRSDSFVVGSPLEHAGALAGKEPGRTYVRESQLVVHPTWPGPASGSHEIHTFLKSMHMVDSLTTHFGFSVKAGMEAPTRPVSAGQVEGGAGSDFPANSFFNVYVVVDIPGGGALPSIQLVNVDPLLVQQTNIAVFPPHVVYQHENSTAVPVYFNTNTIIHDPISGDDISVPRGTLFGQLVLAGHGISFESVEVEAFQVEFENEGATGTMPLTVDPITKIVIEDFAPDYNAAPRSLSNGHFASGGSFVFTLEHLTPNSTNYLQVSSNISSGNWQTIAMIIPPTTSFTFVDPDAMNNPKRYYRLSLLP